MHDPLVVAFELTVPYRPGRRAYLATIWHCEPDGKDAGTVCKWYRRGADDSVVITNAWRWHVHHWRVQIHPLQQLRRAAVTRCEWCHGRSRRNKRVNVSMQSGRERAPWWRSERGLYHLTCSSVATAHRSCVCLSPATTQAEYGRCAWCGDYLSFGRTEAIRAYRAVLRECPPGTAPTAALMKRARDAGRDQ